MCDICFNEYNKLNIKTKHTVNTNICCNCYDYLSSLNNKPYKECLANLGSVEDENIEYALFMFMSGSEENTKELQFFREEAHKALNKFCELIELMKLEITLRDFKEVSKIEYSIKEIKEEYSIYQSTIDVFKNTKAFRKDKLKKVAKQGVIKDMLRYQSHKYNNFKTDYDCLEMQTLIRKYKV